jgi:hypothetical protein
MLLANLQRSEFPNSTTVKIKCVLVSLQLYLSTHHQEDGAATTTSRFCCSANVHWIYSKQWTKCQNTLYISVTLCATVPYTTRRSRMYVPPCHVLQGGLECMCHRAIYYKEVWNVCATVPYTTRRSRMYVPHTTMRSRMYVPPYHILQGGLECMCHRAIYYYEV